MAAKIKFLFFLIGIFICQLLFGQKPTFDPNKPFTHPNRGFICDSTYKMDRNDLILECGYVVRDVEISFVDSTILVSGSTEINFAKIYSWYWENGDLWLLISTINTSSKFCRVHIATSQSFKYIEWYPCDDSQPRFAFRIKEEKKQ